MSADPNPPPTPPDLPPPTAEMSAPTFKRRHKKPDPAAAETKEDKDSEIIILSSLLQDLLARKEVSEPESEVRARVNRFVPRGNLSGGVANPAPAAQSSAQTPAAASLPPVTDSALARPASTGPEAMASIAFPKFEPRAYEPTGANGDWQRNGSTWGRGVLYFAFTAGLALAAFLAGRNNARPSAAPLLPPAPAFALTALSDPELATLDRAVEADQAGDLTAAQQITGELKKSAGPSPLVDAYAFTIDTRLGRTNDVEASLSRRLGAATPPAVAAVFNAAQGFNYTRRREFDRAVDCFTEVDRVQPFNVANLLHLAEAQRRAGKLTDAIKTFQRAAQRIPVGSTDAGDLRGYLAFRQRLSQIEIGQEEAFKAEQDRQMTLPSPDPNWVLTVAALALQKNDLPAAVAALQKAQAALSPAKFTEIVDDYFFRSFVHHPEIAPFLSPESPERQRVRRASMEYCLDP